MPSAARGDARRSSDRPRRGRDRPPAARPSSARPSSARPNTAPTSSGSRPARVAAQPRPRPRTGRPPARAAWHERPERGNAERAARSRSSFEGHERHAAGGVRTAATRRRTCARPATARSPRRPARSGRGAPGRCEKRRPAPFGSEPSGRSTARAAAATAPARDCPRRPPTPPAGRAEQGPRGGVAGERLFGLLRRGVLGGTVDRVLGVRRSASSSPASSPPAPLRLRGLRPRQRRIARTRRPHRPERRRPEPGSRSIRGEDADRVGAQLAGEVRVALGHRRADQRADLAARPRASPAGTRSHRGCGTRG